MHKKSNYSTWIIIAAAAVVLVAGVYYWRKSSGPKCQVICTTTEDGQDCSVVCEPGVSPEVAAEAQKAAAEQV